MLTLAHITDIHLPPLPTVSWRALANKRVLGYLSWHRKRKHEHRDEVLAALCADVAAQDPDHLCITGDLTNIGLPEEYAAVARWLTGLGSEERVSIIPGNHDAYIAIPDETTAARWAPWMRGDGGTPGFPYLRRRGEVSIIGVSTAVATAPFMASGRVGSAQTRRLAAMLAAEREHDQYRIVMIHHPPQASAVSWRKGLHDAARLREVFSREGAELVLHGHLHTSLRTEIPGRDGPIPVFGAASASADGGHGEAAQYHLIHIGDDAADLRIVSRRYDRASGRFEPQPDVALAPAYAMAGG